MLKVNYQRLFSFMLTAGIVSASSNIFASGFQVWDWDGASVGNYHAGLAAIADDASTNFNNPAGLVRIKNQQMVLGEIASLNDLYFKGTVTATAAGFTSGPSAIRSQGGTFNSFPYGHYAAPITDYLVFGLSVLTPFGMKTNYGSGTPLRYSSILSMLKVIDYAPSLGLAINDKISIGFGLDIQHMDAEFKQMATVPGSAPSTVDTISKNNASDTAYFGYHLGLLYQFNPETRVGMSFHSQVVHDLMGNSTFVGPLANNGAGGSQVSSQLREKITIPPITTLSAFHTFNAKWDVMGSVSLVQWSVIKQIVMRNTAGTGNQNNLTTVINLNYQNAWNYSLGTNYHLTENFFFRAGLGYDQDATRNSSRNVLIPDSDRIALALGGHYQATPEVALDFGWTHVFVANASVNNYTQNLNNETIVTDGTLHANTDIYALQLKWDIS